MKTACLTCGVIFAVILVIMILLVGSFQPIGPAPMASAGRHSASAAHAAPGPWWSDRAAGLYGGVAGAVIGLLGGLIGVLTSMGKARALVIGLVRGQIVLGVISLIFGLVAIFKGQPYAVWEPALLGGILLTALYGGLIRTIEPRYRDIELQKMRLQDAKDEGTPQQQ